jgi:hypothetical protein
MRASLPSTAPFAGTVPSAVLCCTQHIGQGISFLACGISLLAGCDLP